MKTISKISKNISKNYELVHLDPSSSVNTTGESPKSLPFLLRRYYCYDI